MDEGMIHDIPKVKPSCVAFYGLKVTYMISTMYGLMLPDLGMTEI